MYIYLLTYLLTFKLHLMTLSLDRLIWHTDVYQYHSSPLIQELSNSWSNSVLQMKQQTEADLPSLPLLVRYVAVLFAIVTVTAVHG